MRTTSISSAVLWMIGSSMRTESPTSFACARGVPASHRDPGSGSRVSTFGGRDPDVGIRAMPYNRQVIEESDPVAVPDLGPALRASASSRPHPKARPRYGKRSAPEQCPPREADFTLLPDRERHIAGYADALRLRGMA